MKALAQAALAAALTGCQPGYVICDEPSAAALSRLPSKLSETGLYADIEAERLAAGVRAYSPRFELWADGASKRRWIALPVREPIDSSDMGSWNLPEGTRLWKEFVRDGVRVETRLLAKIGPERADWAAMAYVWRADGRDAFAAPDGQDRARGTEHDVPAARECWACHGGRPEIVLGFSALQLAHSESTGGWDLEELLAEGALSDPPYELPVVPGDATAQAALGYLHANCGHCHNGGRPAAEGARCFDPRNDLDLWLPPDLGPSVFEAPALVTALGSEIRAGDPARSSLVRVASRRSRFFQMPPLGTDEVDVRGMETVRRWIAQLPSE
jgi:hypothetical protein